MNEINLSTITSLISGVGNFAKNATDTFYRGKGLINAIDYLGIHKNEITRNLKQGKTSSLLNNPLHFMQNFLQDTRRQDSSLDLRKLPMKETGIIFDQDKTPYTLSDQDKQAVKTLI